jgi:hypothetical protein
MLTGNKSIFSNRAKSRKGGRKNDKDNPFNYAFYNNNLNMFNSKQNVNNNKINNNYNNFNLNNNNNNINNNNNEIIECKLYIYI